MRGPAIRNAMEVIEKVTLQNLQRSMRTRVFLAIDVPEGQKLL